MRPMMNSEQAFIDAFAYASYGGLALDTTVAFPDLGAGFQVVNVFDEITPTTPRNITAELSPTWSLQIDRAGVYFLSISGTFEHNSSNQGRLTFIQFYNLTLGAPSGSDLTIATGRNAEATPINSTALIEVTEAIEGHQFQLRIGGGDSYSLVEFNFMEWSMFSVGEFRV